MSKIDIYNMRNYPSIKDALQKLIAPYNCAPAEARHQAIFTPEALEQVLTFLCLNDITHSYTVHNNNSFSKPRFITLNWADKWGNHSMSWWERVKVSDFYLVRFDENWSDEMDVCGFALFTASEFAEWNNTMIHLRELMEAGASFDYFFGTNEYNNYHSFQEFFSCFSSEPISIEAVETMRKTLGIKTYYGFFPGTEDLNCYIEDMARYEEEAE